MATRASSSAIPLFDPPNLDTTEYVDLCQLQDVFQALAQYCGHRMQSMRERTRGAVAAAQETEAKAERVYQSLPPRYRW